MSRPAHMGHATATGDNEQGLTRNTFTTQGERMAYTRLDTLHEPWWQQQPGETNKAYERFAAYCDQPRGARSVTKLAESAQRDPHTIHRQAKANRWEERARAWDQYQSQLHMERVHAKAEKLSEEKIGGAREMLHEVRSAVRDRIKYGPGLHAEEIPKWVDSVVKLSESAEKTHEQVRTVYRQAHAVAQSDGGASGVQVQEIEVPELAGLSPQGQNDRISQIVSSLTRFANYEQREQGNGGA